MLLTPKNILTKDEAWINRSELLDCFPDIYNSVPNDQLRAQINDFFVRALAIDPTEEERRQAAAASVERFPEILDYYIRQKEDRADEAHSDSKRKVDETEFQFIVQINRLVSQYLQGSDFYELGNSYDEALSRVAFLKSVIEDRDGYRLFYIKGKPVQREADLQIMYALTWYATAYDVNREVNNGRGPVDFKISNGKRDKSLVEFKLASNKKLKQNLQNQVDVYEAANDTNTSIKVIMHFSDTEYDRVQKVLKELKLTSRKDIVLIDACATNKPSASNA